MGWCPKCLKEVGDGSKICRECGAILEEVPEHVALSEDGDCGVNDRDAPDPAVPDQRTGESDKPPVVAEPGYFEERLDPPTTADSDGTDETSQAPWVCGKCGEIVPGNFELCWKCEAPSNGQECSESVTEVPEVTGDGRPGATAYLRTLETLEKKDTCVRCGSTRMMRGLSLYDQGQGSDGVAKVVVYGNPEALIFKNAFYSEILADVCADCGHVELSVKNGQDLYDHYLESKRQAK